MHAFSPTVLKTVYRPSDGAPSRRGPNEKIAAFWLPLGGSSREAGEGACVLMIQSFY
jgi:hypothetical protein